MVPQLPLDQLAQLTPVLGSLARLVARGFSPGEDEFRALLGGVGLSPAPELLLELARWADLLRSVRERSSELALSAGVEALILRGLPEAPVVLAVAAVVVARSESASAPALVVAADGSGSKVGLIAAVAAAEPGATILLKRGVHRLAESLLLRQPVTLVGEGMEATELIADRGDCVLGYEGNGLFELLDLTVRWAGRRRGVASVVTVREGEVRIERCCFTGAPLSEAAAGAGLQISGSVHGSIRWCQMEGNGCGIEIGGEADPVLEHNSCRENRWSGIKYCGQSSGAARENACVANGHDGFSLEQDANPLIEANTSQGNQWSGIGCYGAAVGALRNNMCRDNEHNGIYLEDRALPRLLANDCSGNRDSGIAYVGRAGGAAAENTCIGNGKYGICISRQAAPSLEDNECRKNGDSGIAYFGSGAGAARRNVSIANAHYGIYVGDHARPILEGNACEANAWSGLAYFEKGAGTARRNTCSDNGKRGIYVGELARPLLEGNACERNRLGSYLVPGVGLAPGESADEYRAPV